MLAGHTLPASLLIDKDRPSCEHASILASALAECKPLLVPPRTVQVDANRPLNPLDESIVLVPIRFEAEAAHLLEVVLPSLEGQRLNAAIYDLSFRWLISPPTSCDVQNSV